MSLSGVDVEDDNFTTSVSSSDGIQFTDDFIEMIKCIVTIEYHFDYTAYHAVCRHHVIGLWD